MDVTYFAADVPEKCISVLDHRVHTWVNMLEANSFLELLRMSWAAYHGAFYSDVSNGHQITFSGEQGELANLPVNHFRNIAQHIIVTTTSNRPSLEARSVNTDYKSLVQTYLANGLLDYYLREKKLEVNLKRAVETAVVLGAGFIKMEWNATTGEIYDYNEETNTPVYEGDVQFSNLSPFDVVYDSTKEAYSDNDWVIVRSFRNKFDLAAKYPELGDKIRALPTKAEIYRYRLNLMNVQNDTEDVPVYEFYHRRSESMPDGRYLMYLDAKIVLYDGPIPYRNLPVFRISAGDIMGTPYGYTPMFDILPIQEAINSLYSTILSNQNAFGVQNVIVPRGCDINITELVGGLNVIEANTQAGKPEPLNLTQTPAEVFKLLEMLEKAAETISGVSSVARGDPQASLKSGAALALVQSQTLQFLSGLQESYVEMVESVGTALINMLKDFAQVPRLAYIVGKSNRSFMKEFKGEDLASINRVVVDISNPLARCLKKDTPVIMFDGSIKKVQDVVVGDVLMGPDSKPRTVESIATGQEPMYDIHHKSDKNEFIFGCNESHILSLSYCANKDIKGLNLKKGDKIDVSVREFLALPPYLQNLFMGYRTGVDFEKKDTPIPPYILGLWLGDGTSRNASLTTMDEEIVSAWTDYATSMGLNIRVQEQENNRSKVYFITSSEMHGKSDRNVVMNHLHDMHLIMNKHVPKNYLTSDRKDRLELLAGFIDTDGSRVENTFVIVQKDDRLTDDIVYVARSLGFKVTKTRFKGDSGPPSEGKERVICGEYNRIYITGETWEIPTRLPRKQCQKVERRFNHQHYGIEVKPAGIGTYYGFTLKEEPHFLLGDFTVTHNTIAGRVQLAEQLVQYQLLKSPQDYLTILNTGKLEAGTEGLQTQLLLIRGENERLTQLGEVHAVAVDDHKLHIEHHRDVLSDPDLRLDPKLTANVLSHIQEHIDLLRNTDPALLQLLGQQPLQPPPPPPGAPGPTGGPPGGPPMPPQGPSNSPAALEGAPPLPHPVPPNQILAPPQAGAVPARMAPTPMMPGPGAVLPRMPLPASPPPIPIPPGR